MRRHSRDLSDLGALFERLDRASLAAQRRLTVPFLKQVLAAFRQEVPFLEEDRVLYPDMEAATRFVLTHPLLNVLA